MDDNVQSVGNGLNNHDPVKLVFSIPLLLEKILTELDNATVYNSRLVSHPWNNAVLAIFPKRPIKEQPPRALDLQKLFKSSEINPKFDIKLAKAVDFYEHCSCLESCFQNPCVSTTTKFLEFWTQYSNQIENFSFRVHQSTAATIFSSMMSNNCKNIKFLSFHFYDREAIEFPNQIPERGLEFVNLHTIKHNECDNPFPPVFQTPIQSIISKSPNLKRLQLGPNFYPDLSNNKKLEYLAHQHGEAECIDHKKLSKILIQVKDSLKTLKLFRGDEEDFVFDPKDFNFPKMPKLKKLTNYQISLLPMQDFANQTLFDIINSKFPALVKLRIGDSEKTGVQNYFDQLTESIQKPLDKIVTLEIEGIDNPNFLIHFKEWFPNLKKLDLMVSMPITENDDDDIVTDNYIDKVFSKLTQLELKHFVFRINFRFFLCNLVKALIKNVELFQGLSSLELHASGDMFAMVDDLLLKSPGPVPLYCTLESFIQWLVDVTKNGNCVIFYKFSFSGGLSWELMHYIRENNLPVKFMNSL